MPTKIITKPNVQKAKDDINALGVKGLSAKLTDPEVISKKEKKRRQTQIDKAVKEMAEFNRQEELEKEMIRQMGGD